MRPGSRSRGGWRLQAGACLGRVYFTQRGGNRSKTASTLREGARQLLPPAGCTCIRSRITAARSAHATLSTLRCVPFAATCPCRAARLDSDLLSTDPILASIVQRLSTVGLRDAAAPAPAAAAAPDGLLPPPAGQGLAAAGPASGRRLPADVRPWLLDF